MNEISAILVLQNGQIYIGQGFGCQGLRYGECVFTSGMTGYTESLTDPSYAGQILCFASPLIGNVATSISWYESEQMYAEGLIVSSLSNQCFHSQQDSSLTDFLKNNSRGGIQNIDTRRLVKTLRDEGNQPCVLIVGKEKVKMLKAMGFDPTNNIDSNVDPKFFGELIQIVDNPEDIGFLDWARKVSKNRFEGKEYNSFFLKTIKSGNTKDFAARDQPTKDNLQKDKTIVVFDCGVKLNILRELSKRVEKLIVVPAYTTCQQILSYKPDGVLLSNGPGDPRDYQYAVKTVQGLLVANIPMMGICLGHQLLSLAIGCQVYKMKFGNRGANQPVQDLTTNKAYLTSQNHGYATQLDTVPTQYQIFFKNLNDQTVEGIIHKNKPIFSVQFHPEACGGPQDTNWLFDKFTNSL